MVTRLPGCGLEMTGVTTALSKSIPSAPTGTKEKLGLFFA
jgi:hypothetical protein